MGHRSRRGPRGLEEIEFAETCPGSRIEELITNVKSIQDNIVKIVNEQCPDWLDALGEQYKFRQWKFFADVGLTTGVGPTTGVGCR